MAPLAFPAQFPFRCFTYDGGRGPCELALPQPFTGLLTTLRGLPMCCVSGIARQDQFGGLSHVTILHRTMMPCCRPLPLAMVDNALNLRRSLELENHYKFLTDKGTIRITTAILSECMARPGLQVDFCASWSRRQSAVMYPAPDLARCRSRKFYPQHSRDETESAHHPARCLRSSAA